MTELYTGRCWLNAGHESPHRDDVWGDGMADCGRLVEENDWEDTIQYGHDTVELGWVVEPRGINYAASKRAVKYGPIKGIWESE